MNRYTDEERRRILSWREKEGLTYPELPLFSPPLQDPQAFSSVSQTASKWKSPPSPLRTWCSLEAISGIKRDLPGLKKSGKTKGWTFRDP